MLCEADDVSRGFLSLFRKGLQRQENLLGLALRAEQDAEGFRVCCDPYFPNVAA